MPLNSVHILILTAAPCLLLAGCNKYQSSIEAKNACSIWIQERGSYTKIYPEPFEEGTGQMDQLIRYCIEDEKTRKWIGFERGRTEGERVEMALLDQDIEGAVVRKRFEY